jgi:hypothetical protein
MRVKVTAFNGNWQLSADYQGDVFDANENFLQKNGVVFLSVAPKLA